MEADQVAQLAGAVLILAAFIGAQLRRLDPHSAPYLVLNVLGGGVLAVVAAVDSDWGFLLLEAVWTLVSAWSLVQLYRPGAPRPRPG